jgi:ubiquinone/menaquinone biosynthesis C-methylase UbiE
MSKKHKEAVQKQFAKTVDAFAKYAARDTWEVVQEKVAFAKPQSSDVALDVACGPGGLVLALAPHVRFARGLDLTEAMLRQARTFQAERGISNAGFDRGDAEQLPYADASFDLVTCQCSLHHVPKPELPVREMARVAKPQGRVMIIDTVAPEMDEKYELFNRIERLRDPSHASSLRLTTFLRIFEKCHLDVVRQAIKRRTRSFDQWMVRGGHAASQKRYQEVRRILEDSINGDRAGFSPRPEGDDIIIVHNEAMFLLTPSSPRL